MNDALNSPCDCAGKARLFLVLVVFMHSACMWPLHGNETEAGLRRFASFTGPDGWKESVLGRFNEPGLCFRKDIRTISVQLFGAKDSKFTSIEAYMQSLQARGLVRPDLPPTPAGKLLVGGKEVPAYRVKSFAPMGDPHNVHDAHTLREPVEETFVIVPAKEGFFVLKFRFEGMQPPSQKVRDQMALEWLAFLRSFQPKENPDTK